MIRIGHPSRILNSVLDHSLEYRLHNSDESQIVNDVRSEIDKSYADTLKTKRYGDKRKLYQEIKLLRKEVGQYLKTLIEASTKRRKST